MMMVIKEFDDLINNIKSKQSKDLVNKKINDTVNNIGNKKLEDPSDFSLNKDESDQIDYNELAGLTMAKLLLGQLTEPLEPITPPSNLSRTRKTNIPINTKKTTSKELEDADNTLD